MFEVEQKFLDRAGKFKRFLKAYSPISRKHALDIYYDFPQEWTLFRKGAFLRCRVESGKTALEFKFDTAEISNGNSHDVCIEKVFKPSDFPGKTRSLVETSKALGLQCSKDVKSIEEFLKMNSLEPFVRIDKHREEYRIGEFRIALDEVEDLGNFVEIEIVEESKERVKQAIRKISEFSSRFDLEIIRMGYVELYLKKFLPEVYELGRFKDA